ncbi:MAG: class I SAM-dependent methyltransferase [Planctomycetota bacterium]|jgi:predicted SAM-dependent methyltransferase
MSPGPARAAFEKLRWELAAYVRHCWGAWRARRIDFSGKRLNVGCGKHPLPGWINADIRPGTEVVFDLRRRWPIPDAQLQCVRLEHVLEHMGYPQEALHVLSEAGRVLKSGGEIRVGVPDTAAVLLAYACGASADYFRLAKERWHPPDIRLPIEHVNYHFRDRYGEHLFAYDAEALAKLLRRAGLVQIQRAEPDPAIDPEHREAGTLRLLGRKE